MNEKWKSYDNVKGNLEKLNIIKHLKKKKSEKKDKKVNEFS